VTAFVGQFNEGLFSSTTEEWSTPQPFWASLNAEFNFDLDCCATVENAKCRRFYTAADDGLLLPWSGGAVWMNPPYGRTIGAWVAKAWTESRAGSTVVCLIPARTDTGYWHDYVMKAAEVRFIRGRMNFRLDAHRGPAHNAPFPSVVVVFKPGCDGPPVISAMDRSAA
jgi:phage N-6-adenine-methyltransferase